MYVPPHWTPQMLDEALGQLVKGDRFRPYLELRSLDGDFDRQVPHVQSGQTDLTPAGRSSTFTVNDPGRKLHDVEGVNAAHYLAAAAYEILFPSTGVWERVWTHVGAVDTCERDGPQVTVEIAGKARLMMHTAGRQLVIPKGVKRTEAAKRIFSTLGGERRGLMRIPDRPAVLARDLFIGEEDPIFGSGLTLLDSIDLITFYAPDGLLVSKAHPTSPIKPTFRTGLRGRPGGAWLISSPKVKHNFRGFVNEVWFVGHPSLTSVGSGSHEWPVKVRLPAQHPLSAESLARNGVPQVRLAIIEMPKVRLVETGQRIAKDHLRRSVREVREVTAECKPFPFLEPGDLLRLDDRDYSGFAAVDTWSLPYQEGETMTLGWSDIRSTGALW